MFAGSHFKNLVSSLIVTGCVSVSFGFGAFAQNTGGSGTNWIKLCRAIGQAGQAQPQTNVDKKGCVTFQEMLHPQSAQVTVSLGIRVPPGANNRFVSVSVPLQVRLRIPVKIGIDGQDVVNLAYVNCTTQNCNAAGVASNQLLQAMKKGNELLVEVVGLRGKRLQYKMSLKGFTSVLDGAPIDPRTYRQARARLVKSIRARRAQKVRKAIEQIDKQ